MQSQKLKNQIQKHANNVDFKNQKQQDLYMQFMKNPPFFAQKNVVKTFARAQVPDEQNDALKNARKRFEADLLEKKQRDLE